MDAFSFFFVLQQRKTHNICAIVNIIIISKNRVFYAC